MEVPPTIDTSFRILAILASALPDETSLNGSTLPLLYITTHARTVEETVVPVIDIVGSLVELGWKIVVILKLSLAISRAILATRRSTWTPP